MTPQQREQFNQMRSALISIRDLHATRQQLLRETRQGSGLSYETALEYAYDDVKTEAQLAVRGIRAVAEPKGH